MSKITPAQYFDPETDLGRRRIADIPKKFARIRAVLESEPADVQWLVEELARQEERLKQKQGLIPYPQVSEPLQFPLAPEQPEHE
jgi:hypothetical protein